MNTNEKILVYAALIAGVVGTGYGVYSGHKADKIARKLDRTLEDLNERTDIQIKQDIVDKAVEEAAKKQASIQVVAATTKCVNEVSADISKQVKAAVADEYMSIKDNVRVEIDKKVQNISVDGIRQEVIDTAAAKAAQKFDADLENVLRNYNNQLDQVTRIYSSVASKLDSQKQDNGVSFKIG